MAKPDELTEMLIGAVHDATSTPAEYIKPESLAQAKDRILAWMRGIIEEVKPERQGGSDMDNAQEVGHDQAIDEMEFKIEELGL